MANIKNTRRDYPNTDGDDETPVQPTPGTDEDQ